MSDHVSHATGSLPLNIQRQIEQKRAGRRRKVHHHGQLCSKCLENPPRAPGDRYCAECRKIVMREHRRARTQELKRLKALEQLVKQSKGKDNGRSEGSGRSGETG